MFVPGGAATAAPTTKTLGRAVHLKGSNIWYVHGTAVRPKALFAVVAPIPRQSVKVQWAVICQKANPEDPADHIDTRETGGQASVRAAAVVRLSLPYANPPTCVATVYATLVKAGGLSVRLVQTQ
jgi:hypothetical protein